MGTKERISFIQNMDTVVIKRSCTRKRSKVNEKMERKNHCAESCTYGVTIKGKALPSLSFPATYGRVRTLGKQYQRHYRNDLSAYSHIGFTDFMIGRKSKLEVRDESKQERFQLDCRHPSADTGLTHRVNHTITPGE